MNLPSFVWTLLSGAILTVGDITLRIWFETRWTAGFWLVFALYAIGILCMMMSFFGRNIAIATVLAVIINVIAYLIAAHLMYGDTINVQQCVGVGFGLLAIALLELAAE